MAIKSASIPRKYLVMGICGETSLNLFYDYISHCQFYSLIVHTILKYALNAKTWRQFMFCQLLLLLFLLNELINEILYTYIDKVIHSYMRCSRSIVFSSPEIVFFLGKSHWSYIEWWSISTADVYSISIFFYSSGVWFLSYFKFCNHNNSRWNS